MNLQTLRYLITLSKVENYSKAAKMIHISQPTLTSDIHSLEKELGFKLFQRTGRNIELTSAGRKFTIEVTSLLNHFDSVVSSIKTSATNSVIRISALRSISNSFLPTILNNFFKAYPDLKDKIQFKISTDTGLSKTMLANLLNNQFDISFCSKTSNDPSLSFIPIAKQQVFVIVPQNHPLAKYKHINLLDTTQYDYIAFSRSSGLYEYIRTLFTIIGKTPHVEYYVEEDETVTSMVKNGFGIAIVPDNPVLAQSNLVKIAIDFPNPVRYLYMVTNNNNDQQPYILKFTEFIKQNYADPNNFYQL